MIALIQRVTRASVVVEDDIVGEIKNGLLVFLGIAATDTTKTIEWLSKKIVGLRIFSDQDDKMNFSVKDLDADILLVSQFTLYANVKKGNRPSFTDSAPPSIAIPLYEQMIKALEDKLEKPIQTGKFGADMKINLLNDGPVTICIDTQQYGV
ncbi:MAG: D-tyrosyl-tRNA(Tyr) deacylase [Flexibacter sp. CG_4_10_14_3_um_filter_32_15]|nr:MAG: D-tyrosyl-tRNA(Tyr) deacylase [Flexibacter sp. CG_4_10_14_3_um_filter_32_15]